MNTKNEIFASLWKMIEIVFIVEHTINRGTTAKFYQ